MWFNILRCFCEKLAQFVIKIIEKHKSPVKIWGKNHIREDGMLEAVIHATCLYCSFPPPFLCHKRPWWHLILSLLSKRWITQWSPIKLHKLLKAIFMLGYMYIPPRTSPFFWIWYLCLHLNFVRLYWLCNIPSMC